jgi:hypothetical protein
MHRTTLSHFMEKLKCRSFMESEQVLELVERTTGLVSRDKLMDLRLDAQEAVANPDRYDASGGGGGSKVWDWFLARSGGGRAEAAARPWAIALAVLLSAIAYCGDPFPDDPVATRASSFLAMVVSLWLFKAIPFHATAMLICPLVVFFDVLRDPAFPDDKNATLTSEKAASFVLSAFFNHNTFLILGGCVRSMRVPKLKGVSSAYPHPARTSPPPRRYTISAAFSRCEVEKRLACQLQTTFEDSPRLFLLAMMLLGLFLSMWISNHTYVPQPPIKN